MEAGIVSFVLFIAIFLNPFNFLFRKLRYGLGIALWNILTAPFGSVTFKNYLLAEILCDMAIQLSDFGKIFSFFV